MDTRLQLANPVSGGGIGQLGIALQVLLEACFVELRVVEGGKIRRQPTERPDEPELRCYQVDDKAELHFLYELERIPALSFDVIAV